MLIKHLILACFQQIQFYSTAFSLYQSSTITHMDKKSQSTLSPAANQLYFSIDHIGSFTRTIRILAPTLVSEPYGIQYFTHAYTT